MYLLGLKQNISGENNRDITNRRNSLKEARVSRMNLFELDFTPLCPFYIQR